jgi:hypothetical protein
MLETIGIPILLKAVEFLFGQGSKILEERRERRKAEQEAKKEKPEDIASSFVGTTKPVDMIQSKEAALSQPVSEIVWSNSEANIKHLLSLLEIHTKNYYLAREQYAKWGSALVPPIIVSNLTEAENEIAKTTKELQAALSKVYGKKVAAPEIEQA